MDEKYFDAKLSIQADRQNYTDLKAIIDEGTGNSKSLIRFNDKTNTIEIGYNHVELSEVHPFFYQMLQMNHLSDRESVFEKFGTPAYKAEYKLLSNTLFQCAASIAKSFKYVDFPPFEQNKADESPDNNLMTLALEQGYPGVIVGDIHTDAKAKIFICKHLKSFAEKGGNTLYIEGFRPEHQPDIDSFLATGEMSEQLKYCIERLDYQEYNGSKAGSTKTLFETARQLNLRIIGIDSIHARPLDQQEEAFRNKRVLLMNQFACDIINETLEGRFLVLTGESHANTQPGGIPGLSQLLNIPALLIGDDGKSASLAVENKENRQPGAFLTSLQSPMLYGEAMDVISTLSSDGSKRQRLHDDLKKTVRRHLPKKRDHGHWRDHIQEGDISDVILRHTGRSSLSYEERLLLGQGKSSALGK